MITTEEFKVDINTDLVSAEGLTAEFDIEIEQGPAEPYSWGQSRGTDISVSARFKLLKINNLVLWDNEVIDAFGREIISEWEDQIVEQVLEGEFQ